MNGIGGSYTRATPESEPVLIQRTLSVEEYEAEQAAQQQEQVNVTINE